MWASIARDVLAIQASSVSSERAFSSASITITKRRNRLLPDIVEALQGLMSKIANRVLFLDPPPSSALEKEIEEEAEKDGEGKKRGEGGLVIDLSDNEESEEI